MQRVEVEMFSDAVNRPVLRVPGRRFPGVVIQGDILSGLVTNAEALLRVLTEANLPAADDAEELCTQFSGLLEHYAETLTDNGIPLPFVMSSAAPADQRLHVAGASAAASAVRPRVSPDGTSLTMTA